MLTLVLLLGCGHSGESQRATHTATSSPPSSSAPASPKGRPAGQADVSTMAPISSQTGLSWYVLQEGTGAVAATGDQVAVHYTGWLTDGTKFDSSLDRGEPIKFPVGMGRVIKGWDEGVTGMKIGEKRQLHIPSALGYGARGAGGVIPPNADLIFDVELVSIDGK